MKKLRDGTIMNHLYYADDLALIMLIAPSSNGMLKLIAECESYAEVYGLKFNELKSVLLSCKPINFKMSRCMNTCFNGAPIPVETSCRYLGHIIANDLNDNEDIRRQLRCFFWRSNMLLRTFGACSSTVKLLLFMSYFGPAFGVDILKSSIIKWKWHIMMFSGDSLIMTDFPVLVKCL